MKTRYLGWIAACLILLSGCTLRLVAPYDPQTVQQAQSIERDIEYLYLSMQALPESERLYARFTEQYLKIDVSVRGLERRQARREQNQETLTQAQTGAILAAGHENSSAKTNLVRFSHQASLRSVQTAY